MVTLETNMQATRDGREWRPISERCAQIFCLFESVCPICGEDATITAVGGTPEFHERQQFSEGVVSVWNTDDPWGEKEPTEPTDQGGVEFECENGHRHYISHAYGDWQ